MCWWFSLLSPSGTLAGPVPQCLTEEVHPSALLHGFLPIIKACPACSILLATIPNGLPCTRKLREWRWARFDSPRNGVIGKLLWLATPGVRILPKTRFSGCDVFHLLYPLGLREEELRRYFIGEASVSQLAKDISGSVVKVDDLRSEIRIADMQGPFSLQRDHVIRLCEAFLDRALTPEALNTVALPSRPQTLLSGRTR